MTVAPTAKQIRDSFERPTQWGKNQVEAKSEPKPLKRAAA